MTSKHYKWQQRWRVDRAAGQAVHESGLCVPFDAQGMVRPAVNVAQIEADMAVIHGGHNAPLMVRRLEREAEQLVREHFDGRRRA